jgi:hypothetical protein
VEGKRSWVREAVSWDWRGIAKCLKAVLGNGGGNARPGGDGILLPRERIPDSVSVHREIDRIPL